MAETKVNTSGTKDKLREKASQSKAPQQGSNGGQVQKQAKGSTIQGLIEKMMPSIKKALPAHIKPERMGRIALTAVRNNPKLGECDQMSFLGALMQSAQLGLEPNTPLGEAYIIPYKNQAQFQMGYKGILSLAHRSGEYQAIYAHEVYENDDFHFQLGIEKTIHHIPADIPEGDPIYYYAVYKLKNGGYDFVVQSTERIKKHSQKYSSSVKQNRSSPWSTDFDAMAKKTVLLMVLKYAPKSIEFAQQISSDETVKKGVEDEPFRVEVDEENVIDYSEEMAQ